MTLPLMQSTVSVNLNLTCHHTSQSVSNFTMVTVSDWYCSGDQLKVDEVGHKFAPNSFAPI